jgi:protein-S-isoprenylcysteine O-methyltransferase Ste14
VLYVRAAVAFVAPILVDGVVPVWLLSSSGGRFELGAVRFFALPLIVLGAWLLVDSVFLRFAREGRGTLAPLDPPRFVVRGGAYRVVRNPMYVANVAILLGEGLVFRSWRILAWAGTIFVAFHLFTVFYEEPTLRRLFGDDYEQYCRQVGRWLPRRRSRPAQ